jgi:hypothetical protein
VLRPIASLVRNSAPVAVVLSLAPFALLSAACSSSSGDGTNPDGGAGTSADDAASSGSSSGGGTASGATSSGGSSSGGSSSGATSSGGDAAPTGEAGSSGGGAGPASVVLGTAGNYVILAESAISNVPTSVITGDLGLSPAAASYITGLSLTRAGVKWTTPQVVGSVFAADNDPPTPTNLTTADTHAAGRPTPAFLNVGGGAIGGMTLAPGLYKWTSAVTIPTDVAIAGAPNDAWIFQISGNLTMSGATKMTLSGGAQAKNIVWQVAGAVDLGTTSHAEGVVMSKTEITLETGASINGRLFAQTAVHVAGATVTAP